MEDTDEGRVMTEITRLEHAYGMVWDTFFAPLFTKDREKHVEKIIAQLNCGDDPNNNCSDSATMINGLLLDADRWMIHAIYAMVMSADWEPTDRYRDAIQDHLTGRLRKRPSREIEQAVCSLAAGIANWAARQPLHGTPDTV